MEDSVGDITMLPRVSLIIKNILKRFLAHRLRALLHLQQLHLLLFGIVTEVVNTGKLSKCLLSWSQLLALLVRAAFSVVIEHLDRSIL